MRSVSAASVFPRRLIYGRDLLRELVVRDMKLRYKRSTLGMLWTLVNPLAQPRTIRERCTSCWLAVRRRRYRCSVFFSSSVSSIATVGRPRLAPMPLSRSLEEQATKPPQLLLSISVSPH